MYEDQSAPSSSRSDQDLGFGELTILAVGAVVAAIALSYGAQRLWRM